MFYCFDWNFKDFEEKCIAKVNILHQ